MSKLLKRYALVKFVNRGGENDKKMMIEPDGPWVNHDDYAELQQERNRLRHGIIEAKRINALAPSEVWAVLHAALGGDDE
jgi:hypothetical protein